MQHKRILLVIDGSALDQGVLNLVSNCLSGENIHLTVCVFSLDKEVKITHSDLADLTEICALNRVDLQLRLFKDKDAEAIAKHCNFADLLIIQREILEVSEFSSALSQNVCPVMILQQNYRTINHVILTVDGSRQSVIAIKQFAQLFHEKIKNIDVTLIFIMDDMDEFGDVDELLLVEYLKQYCQNLGVLKLLKPLTIKKLKALKCDTNTLVVKGNVSPIEDTFGVGLVCGFDPSNSMVFLPAEA